MTLEFSIDNKLIGGQSTYIIAEISANHGGDIRQAIQAIHEAKLAGADAVKIQTYTPETITLNCQSDDFVIKNGSIWDGQDLYSLYQSAYTPYDWHSELFHEAKKAGITLFSSPFDDTAVSLLESLGAPAYKIASPEIFDLELIRLVAKTGKPIILSTGLASLVDVSTAVDQIRNCGNNNICLLKCTSEYPAPASKANLLTIPHIRETFQVIPGLSDHTISNTSASVAVALGAKVIEKHFKPSSISDTPDSSFSLDPNQFKELVQTVRESELLLGSVHYQPHASDLVRRPFAGRSLYTSSAIKKGESLTRQNVRSVRPGYGLHPKFLPIILESIASRDLPVGHAITHSDYQPSCD